MNQELIHKKITYAKLKSLGPGTTGMITKAK